MVALDHVLQVLQRSNLNDVACGLGLEDRLFLRWTVILQRPGLENIPGPRLPGALPMSFDNASKTAATSFLLNSVCSEMLLRISVLDGAFFTAAFAIFRSALLERKKS